MTRAGLVALVLLLGCSGVRVPQPEAPPPRAERAQEVAAAPDAAATGERAPTDEAATEIFLDHEIERRRYVPPAPLTPWAVAPFGVAAQPDGSYADGRSRLPWMTAVGAGLGAVIGNQYGDSGRGAAIGGGIGLLFDLGRWY